MKNDKNQKYFSIFTIILVIIGVGFISDYIPLIIVSIITALLFNPFYYFFSSKFKKKYIINTLTITTIFFSFFLPILLVTYFLLQYLTGLLNDLGINGHGQFLSEYIFPFVDKLNSVISKTAGEESQISRESVTTALGNIVSIIASFLVSLITSLAKSVPNFITQIIIFTSLLIYIFPNQEKIFQFIEKISPLDKQNTDLYRRKLKNITLSVVKGQGAVAFMQGLIGGISLYIVGIPYSAFWTLILMFLSIIPLGGGILTIPLGIILILIGQVWQGLLILLTHFLIVTTIDSPIRNRFVAKSKDIKIPSPLTIISVFAGVKFFGFIGIIYGPLIIIFIATTIDIHNNYLSKRKSEI